MTNDLPADVTALLDEVDAFIENTGARNPTGAVRSPVMSRMTARNA